MKTGLRIFSLTVLVIAGIWLFMTLESKKSQPAKTTAAKNKIKVIATIFPLADIAKQVGGERIEVITLLPPGASPHTFEPTPRQVAEFSDARILVEIGAGLDSWADKTVKNAGPQNIKTVISSENIKLLKESHIEHEKNHHEKGNPHIWLDPILAKEIVKKIEKTLIAVDPEGKNYYQIMAANYQQELDRLDIEIKNAVKKFRIREYITFHPSWTYFGIRYGIKEAGIIEETPGKEPTAKQVKKIVDSVKNFGIKAVFAEPQFSSKIAEAIAENAGAKVLFLDPLGNPEITDRSTYLDLMRYNLKVMKEAME